MRPSGRHLLLAGGILALVLLLLIEGFTTKTVGSASTLAEDGSGHPLAGQGPILSYQGGGLKSRPTLGGKVVSLTFDDGPDPNWTPKIAAILQARHVPATFFEVGSMVVRHPELTRMLHQDGFLIGDHTFTHADPADLPGWERSAQISATEAAIAGVTGIRPRLVRPPYSSTADAVSTRQERAWATIAADGYTIVLSNLDTEDWMRPGVARIVENGTPPGGQGGIILMHDAGGDRSETVAALPRLIDRLRSRGYRFVSLPQLARLPLAAMEQPATPGQRASGRLFDLILGAAGWLTNTLTLLVELVTFLVAVRMAAGLALARAHVRRIRREPRETGFTPSVTLIVPAYNEAAGIERTVRSLAGSSYPGEYSVVVVDDGSTDGTGDLVRALELENVQVIGQPNAGKSAALNRGLDLCHSEIVVTVDADTVFEPETLRYLVQRFRDPEVGAVSGNTKVGNRRSLIGHWQHIEYVMGFNLDRRAYELLGATPTVPGAIGGFRAGALRSIGGLSGATLAEDTDVTLELARAGWKVLYEQRARAWTEAPSSLRMLYRQRERWAFGTIQSAWKHRRALWGRGEHRYGRAAVAVLALFQMLLPLTAPLVDLFAIYSIVFLDPMPILAFWGAFNLFQATLAFVAFGLDGERRRVLWALPLQQLLWRQLMYLVVLDGVISAAMGTRQSWRHSVRTGENAIGGFAGRRRTGWPARLRLQPLRLITAGVLALGAVPALLLVTAVRHEVAQGRAYVAPARAERVNPFVGQRLYVSHDTNAYWAEQNLRDAGRLRQARLMGRIADQPQAEWFGDWSDGHGSTFGDVRAYVGAAQARHAMALLVLYDIPGRDCNQYSAGGAPSPAAYAAFIDQVARGIGGARVAVILEPDALPELDCLSRAHQSEYYAMLSAAVTRLEQNPQTAVYLDAGNRGWISPAVMARRLIRAGIARARGFSLNVSNFDSTRSETAYGMAILRHLPGGHFVIDTSRNGRGSAPGAAWCNPAGRGLGTAPTARTGNPAVDALLWIKAPGESDGTCGMRGAPPAGDWWPGYALMLARNSAP